jgi:hypothetical protein
VAGSDYARQAHRKLVGAFAVLPPHQPAGFVRYCGGAMVAATGSPMAFFNQVLPVADDVSAVDLAEAVEAAIAANLSCMAHLRGGVDDGLGEVLRRAGLEETNQDYPAMVLTSLPDHAAAPVGVDVVRVRDATGFDAHLRTAAANAGADPDVFRTWLSPGILHDPAVALFVGYVEGTPVATSISIRTDDVVGVLQRRHPSVGPPPRNRVGHDRGGRRGWGRSGRDGGDAPVVAHGRVDVRGPWLRAPLPVPAVPPTGLTPGLATARGPGASPGPRRRN